MNRGMGQPLLEARLVVFSCSQTLALNDPLFLLVSLPWRLCTFNHLFGSLNHEGNQRFPGRERHAQRGVDDSTRNNAVVPVHVRNIVGVPNRQIWVNTFTRPGNCSVTGQTMATSARQLTPYM